MMQIYLFFFSVLLHSYFTPNKQHKSKKKYSLLEQNNIWMIRDHHFPSSPSEAFTAHSQVPHTCTLGWTFCSLWDGMAPKKNQAKYRRSGYVTSVTEAPWRGWAQILRALTAWGMSPCTPWQTEGVTSACFPDKSKREAGKLGHSNSSSSVALYLFFEKCDIPFSLHLQRLAEGLILPSMAENEFSNYREIPGFCKLWKRCSKQHRKPRQKKL